MVDLGGYHGSSHAHGHDFLVYLQKTETKSASNEGRERCPTTKGTKHWFPAVSYTESM